MDLSKLTPAPWHAGRMDTVSYDGDGTGPYKNVYHDNPKGKMHLGERLPDTVARGEGDADECRANAEFIALARNAFDVMMRRGWQVLLIDGKWHVFDRILPDGKGFGWIGGVGAYEIPADPFTALVEADAWYKANIEAKP